MTATFQIIGTGLASARARGSWVDASPFRAHLRHLMDSERLTAGEVALLAGLTPRFAVALISGRRGRVVRRITSEQASRLLRLTVSDVSRAGRRRVPARLACRPVRRLQSAGWETERVAALLGLSGADLVRLLEGQLSTCTQLVALRAAAAAALLGVEAPEDEEEMPAGLAA